MTGRIVVLGIFAADATFRADRAPVMGETLVGNSFSLGPGGKGSNQAVAAARAGGDVHFISRLGRDVFADLAFQTWKDAGVSPVIRQLGEVPTGAASIFVEETTGNNAIIVCPGAAGEISQEDVEENSDLIEGASVFLTQLEQPMDAAIRGLQMAKAAGAITILNPAPATELPKETFPLCDYITPNESEAEGLTGIVVSDLSSAERAADALLELGVGTALITLGENGVLLRSRNETLHVEATAAGEVVETTDAGDAFNGGFAVALAEGKGSEAAVRFGCATAGISVTRPGAAASMPTRAEVDSFLGS